MSKFSDRLTSLRNEKGLSQEKLGELINKKRTTVSGYENAGKEPDIETLCFLANFFGVTTDFLLGKTDERNIVDSAFFNSSKDFKKEYAAAPYDMRKHAESCLDAFYRLISREIKLGNADRLSLYVQLFNEMASLRAQIGQKVALSNSNSTEVSSLVELMSLQTDLKNAVAAYLDKLMQADMDVAFGNKKENTSQVV